MRTLVLLLGLVGSVVAAEQALDAYFDHAFAIRESLSLGLDPGGLDSGYLAGIHANYILGLAAALGTLGAVLCFRRHPLLAAPLLLGPSGVFAAVVPSSDYNLMGVVLMPTGLLFAAGFISLLVARDQSRPGPASSTPPAS